MKREPDLGPEQAGATRSRLSSEWMAFRARVPFLLRRLIIGLLALFVICAIPWTYFNIKYSGEVARELARLRAAGEPLTIEEMIPEPVPDDQNAAVLYQEVFQVVFDPDTPQPEREVAFGVIPPDEYNRLLDSLGHDETFEVDLAREVFSRPEVVAVLAKLEEASKRPHVVWPIRWQEGFTAVFPHMAQYGEAARLCSMRARLSAADSDIDGALRWVGIIVRTSWHAMEGPTLIAQLVGIAINSIGMRAAEEVLSEGMPSPEAAAELRDLAGGPDVIAGFHRALQAERALGLAMFGYVERGGAEAMDNLLDEDSFPADLLAPYSGPLGAPLRSFDQARLLANWRTMMPNLDQPYRLQDPGTTGWALRADSKLAVLTHILLPAVGRASMRRDQAIAMLDELGIVLELKTHKREHGVYPATLDELQATLDRELPTDPFSGEAYRYQRRGEGFILWSIGQDLEDDGGIPPKPRSDLKWGEADIVWECEG